MTTRLEVIEQARKYLGVRFHHQGRNSAGLDCAGLVVRVAHDLELSSFDSRDYGREPNAGMLKSVMESNMDRVRKYVPGDVVLMRFNKEPQHLAIVTELGIIHAYAQARKVVEHSLDTVWLSRIIAAYSFRGLNG